MDVAASTMLSAQVSLAQLEELLANWARWCHGRLFLRQCVVLDLDYEASGEEAQEARRQPNPVPPRDYDGLLIERMLLKMAAMYRLTLQVEYVKVRRKRGETTDQWQERKRRKLKIPAWQYLDRVALAKRMLVNLLRRHG